MLVALSAMLVVITDLGVTLMSAVPERTQMGKISWKLRQVLADRKLTNKQLADELGSHPTSISRLKQRDTLPAIGSEEIERIRQAISALSGRECFMSELVKVED